MMSERQSGSPGKETQKGSKKCGSKARRESMDESEVGLDDSNESTVEIMIVLRFN